MPQRNLVNAVDAALTVAMDTTIVTMSVDDAAKLPPVPFFVVVDPFDDAVREYMECTSIAGNVLTVVRAVEGSTVAVTILPVNPPVTILPTNQPAALPAGSPHAVGAIVRIAIMAQHLDELWAEVSGNYLRLDAGNDPALRHDIVLESAGVFDGASFVSTPDVNLLDADTAHNEQSIGQRGAVGFMCVGTYGPLSSPQRGFSNGVRYVVDAGVLPTDKPYVEYIGKALDTGGVPAVEGDVLSISTDAEIDDGLDVSINVMYWDATDLYITQTVIAPTTGDGGWKVLTGTATAPANTASISLRFLFNSPTVPNGAATLGPVCVRKGTDPSFVPSLRIVGDLDMRIDMVPTALGSYQRPISSVTGGTSGYSAYLHTTAGRFVSQYGDGVGYRDGTAPTDPIVQDVRQAIRMVADLSAQTWEFWKDDVSLGTTVLATNSPGDGNINDLLFIGALNQTTQQFIGDIYSAEIRDGIDGPVVARYDAAEHLVGGDEYTGSDGRVWTATGSFTFKTTVSPAATLDDISSGSGGDFMSDGSVPMFLAGGTANILFRSQFSGNRGAITVGDEIGSVPIIVLEFSDTAMDVYTDMDLKPGVFITTPEVPTLDAHLTNKAYVDAGDVGVPQTFLHADLTDVSPDQHHTKYTDAEAVTAVGPHLADAPSDGTPYSRQDAAWIAAGGGGGDSTYLRLDATNDPAQRHDVVMGGLLSFDGASYLSTPNTPDLAALDDVDITADVQSDWDTTPSATFFMNGDFTVGQSLGFDLSGNRSSVRLNTNAISGLNDSMVGSSRHSIRVTSDGAEIVSYVDGIEVKRLAVVAPSGPVALPLLVGTGWSSGSSFNQFIGNIYSAQIGHFNQPPIATFNADDLIGQISEGPVPDGTTFTSGGRVWTVVGAGVTFAGTASPVATLDDINAFPVQEAPLDSLQYLRQDGAWVPFAAASITDLNTLDTRLDIVDTAFHQLLTALTARVQALEAP